MFCHRRSMVEPDSRSDILSTPTVPSPISTQRSSPGKGGSLAFPGIYMARLILGLDKHQFGEKPSILGDAHIHSYQPYTPPGGRLLSSPFSPKGK